MTTGLWEGIRYNYRGLLSVFGAFLVQLTIGSYHGTFGNLLPYFSSYVKQADISITHGDLAMVLSAGGIAQGISYMMGGLIFVPVFGKRGCLMFGAALFTLAPLLTYFTLDTNLAGITLSYGILGGSATNIVMVPTLLIPVSWFPDHKGKVLGIVTSGFGMSSFVFAPLQTFMINPSNIHPVQESGSNASSAYFEEEQVLENIPMALIYLGVIYAAVFVVGVLLTVEKPTENKVNVTNPKPTYGTGGVSEGEAPPIENKSSVDQNLVDRLRKAFSYLINDTFTCLDFYLLFLTRFLFLAVGGGVLAHWKMFSFTQSTDDKLVTLAGGVNGVMNCVFRVVAGALVDRFKFNQVMPVIASLLTIVLLSIFYIGKLSFIGLIICMWSIYGLSFVHFSTGPAQTLRLFKSEQSSVVVGTIGLAESFSYAFLGIVNELIMSHEEDPRMFLWLFISLAVCSFLAIIVTGMVSADQKAERSSPI